MKGRESGMPDESYWESFFDPDRFVEAILSSIEIVDVVEFGCGYGTFTLPVARHASGVVHALDIDVDSVERVGERAAVSDLGNIRAMVTDFVADGTGLDAGSQDHAMVWNLLHIEDPVALLREARRVLRPGGTLSVVHWRSDIPTPRGPSLAIRPTPDQCAAWMLEAGFGTVASVDLRDSAPYHFGLLAAV